MLFSIRGEIQIKNQKNTFKIGLPKVFDLLEIKYRYRLKQQQFNINQQIPKR